MERKIVGLLWGLALTFILTVTASAEVWPNPDAVFEEQQAEQEEMEKRNAEIEAENKRIEEENKRIEEENKRIAEHNAQVQQQSSSPSETDAPVTITSSGDRDNDEEDSNTSTSSSVTISSSSNSSNSSSSNSDTDSEEEEDTEEETAEFFEEDTIFDDLGQTAENYIVTQMQHENAKMIGVRVSSDAEDMELSKDVVLAIIEADKELKVSVLEGNVIWFFIIDPDYLEKKSLELKVNQKGINYEFPGDLKGNFTFVLNTGDEDTSYFIYEVTEENKHKQIGMATTDGDGFVTLTPEQGTYAISIERIEDEDMATPSPSPRETKKVKKKVAPPTPAVNSPKSKSSSNNIGAFFALTMALVVLCGAVTLRIMKNKKKLEENETVNVIPLVSDNSSSARDEFEDEKMEAADKKE